MRNLSVTILLLIFASCAKEKICEPISEVCIVEEFKSMGRCPDPVTGKYTEWVYEFNKDTFYLKCRSSKDALLEMEDEITSVTCLKN